MFRKKVKKVFPPGTFIPTPARVMAILQLSLGLMLLLWQLSQPFMGDLFSVRTKTTLFEYVFGTPDGTELHLRNAERFKGLPAEEQATLIAGYKRWESKLGDTFLTKVKTSIENLLLKAPLFENMWIILSIVLPILILLKVEGATHAAWLVPIVVFAYAVDNQWHGSPVQLTPEQRLFPTELYLIENYADGNLPENSFLQRDQLKNSWDRYLVQEWTHETPSKNAEVFSRQLETGIYNFTKARALAAGDEPASTKPPRRATLTVLAYLLWNIAFAYVVTKYNKCNNASC